MSDSERANNKSARRDSARREGQSGVIRSFRSDQQTPLRALTAESTVEVTQVSAVDREPRAESREPPPTASSLTLALDGVIEAAHTEPLVAVGVECQAMHPRGAGAVLLRHDEVHQFVAAVR